MPLHIPVHLRRKVCRLLHAAVGNHNLSALDGCAKGKRAARAPRALRDMECNRCAVMKKQGVGLLKAAQQMHGQCQYICRQGELTTTTTVLPASGELLASVLLGVAAGKGGEMGCVVLSATSQISRLQSP